LLTADAIFRFGIRRFHYAFITLTLMPPRFIFADVMPFSLSFSLSP
jgi:hypothetical protein